MIKRRYTYIFRVFVVFSLMIYCGTNAYAQEADTVVTDSTSIHIATSMDSTMATTVQEEPQIEEDSVIIKKFLSGVELVVDYGKILTLWTKFESKYEAGVNIRFFEKIVLAGEFGYSELNPLKAYDNALYYTVKGSYGRIGLDYYTAYDPKSFYYAGFRYGTSMFEDEGVFLIDSEYWEDYEEGFGSTDITASWFELILGTETYLNIGRKKSDDKPSKLLLGWKFRFRILGDFTNREAPTIYSIPGYGRTFDKTVPALNLYVKYRFGR